MPIKYLKKAIERPAEERGDVRAAVSKMLDDIKANGQPAVERYSCTLDKWQGGIVLSESARRDAIKRVPESVKQDIQFAHANIEKFAQAQRESMRDCEVELLPGHWAGQKHIPVSSAGCYVPGGRYSHVASALMTITTAKVAGVAHITAASPPRPVQGIPDAIVYAMDLAGADVILTLGGVQAVTAMAFGLFGTPKADILVGPGNSYVAEAKRMLYGDVGIDMFAGPTDTCIIADDDANSVLVAWDLVGQAEHGVDSPCRLVTTSEALAGKVLASIPGFTDSLPAENANAARTAWRDRGEVVICDTREEMATVADTYAPEHLHVNCRRDSLNYWKDRLSAYGSLFLGEETTVPFGDKVSGPNHVLPTSGSARYTGGLSVHKFMKTVTWQRTDKSSVRELAVASARISRLEGMEGHARSSDIRLETFFPGETFDVSAPQ